MLKNINFKYTFNIKLIAIMSVLVAAIGLTAAFLEKNIATAAPATCTSVSQYGVTFTFNKSYPCGNFANGDPWVAPNGGDSAVVVTAMAPAFASGQNGWEVNPQYTGGQGFDSDAPDYNAALVPTLPYNALPNQSLVKATSAGSSCPNNIGCLQTAVVLTVLPVPPPDETGAGYLRPPYVAGAKPLYPISQLRTDLLPSLAPPAGYTPESISSINSEISRLQLDIKGGLANRNLHPIDNMPDYGSSIAVVINGSIGRLALNDPVNNKMPLLINVVQAGLDRYHSALLGQTWVDPGPGHNMGRKLSIVFAATMINDTTMKNNIGTQANFRNFHEDIGIQVGKNGVPLFGGFEYTVDEDHYWDYVSSYPGSNEEMADPYGWVDGGNHDTTDLNSYQYCCTAMPWKGAALMMHLMPDMQSIWQNQATIRGYVDRWVTSGSRFQPDPCAPVSQGGGPLPGNEVPMDCIKDPDLVSPTGTACQAGKQCGRFPELHGRDADDGFYQSNIINELWTDYRGTITTPSTTTPLYRLYAPAANYHFWTASTAERDWLTNVRKDFVVEGNSGGVYASTGTGLLPLYRLYAPSVNKHFWTTSSAERDWLKDVRKDFVYEGITGYVSQNTGTGLTSLYRLYAPSANKHFWTNSSAEKDWLSITRKDFVLEGTVGYVGQ